MNLPCAECGERVDPKKLKKKTGTRSHKKICPTCYKVWKSKDNAYQKHLKREENENAKRLVKGAEVFGCLDALQL